jgi:carbon storage regulator
MLVLSRKRNESIVIGDDIEVSVLSVAGEKVRLGIDAPRDIPVFRKEVYLEIQQQRLEAGTSAREEVDEALKRLSGD